MTGPGPPCDQSRPPFNGSWNPSRPLSDDQTRQRHVGTTGVGEPICHDDAAQAVPDDTISAWRAPTTTSWPER
jgi:hypothetical protein